MKFGRHCLGLISLCGAEPAQYSWWSGVAMAHGRSSSFDLPGNASTFRPARPFAPSPVPSVRQWCQLQSRVSVQAGLNSEAGATRGTRKP